MLMNAVPSITDPTSLVAISSIDTPHLWSYTR